MSIREGKSVKRFERSNGLDTALYKNDFFLPIKGVRPYKLFRCIHFVAEYIICSIPL